MSLLIRLIKACRDGSIWIKILNRYSKVQYAPSQELILNDYFLHHFPGDPSRDFSINAKKLWIQIHSLFESYRIENIAYMGAHEGGVAIALNELFPNLYFYLIEPVPSTFQVLVENTLFYKNMCCINVAAGSENAQMEMFIDGYSQASSILRYDPLALDEYPFLGSQQRTKVQVRRLDDILREYNAQPIDMLIMDVQGFEDHALEGATKTLNECGVVISELSLQKLYIGGSSFDSVYKTLTGRGFILKSMMNPMEGRNHQILQIDGVFVREKIDGIQQSY
jgi:FkbM family methyltransferase